MNAIKKIIDIELRGLVKRLETLGYGLELTDEAKNFVAQKGYDVQFGARPLKRAIQTYIEDGVCEMMLDGKVKNGDVILADKAKDKDELVFNVK